MKTSPANFNISNNNGNTSNNNSKSKKNFNRSTLNNFEKNSLPKISKSKNKEGANNDDLSYNTNTMQMSSSTGGHIKYKDNNEPHIVKVFRKNK